MHPLSETRNYVMRVLEATQVYRARINGGAAPITLSADLKRGGYNYVPTTNTASPYVALSFWRQPERPERRGRGHLPSAELPDLRADVRRVRAALAGVFREVLAFAKLKPRQTRDTPWDRKHGLPMRGSTP